MPNWCCNFITFYAECNEAEKQLYELNKKLVEIYKKNNELSVILEGHGLNPDNYSCRGSINYLE